jgi:hypothetical protein
MLSQLGWADSVLPALVMQEERPDTAFCFSECHLDIDKNKRMAIIDP